MGLLDEHGIIGSGEGYEQYGFARTAGHGIRKRPGQTLLNDQNAEESRPMDLGQKRPYKFTAQKDNLLNISLMDRK